MQKLTKYVNTNIGTVGHLLTATSPSVHYPHGMMQISPNFNPRLGDRYFADKIFSFPVGPVSIMACRRGDEKFASEFDHDIETAAPHMYSVYLETPKIEVVYSVTSHCAIFEFDFGDNAGDIILNMSEDETLINGNEVNTVGKYFAVPAYLNGVFSKQPDEINNNRFSFSGGKVIFKAGVSFIDADQAKANLQIEIPDFDIGKVIATGEAVWDKLLNKILVRGNEEHKYVFYTAMYRAFTRPFNISEHGRYYSNYDKQVHNDDGHEFYCGDGLWDTFRCMHPLHLILTPDVHEDVLASYIRMYEQSGLMPNFPYPAKDNAFMIGFHSASLFADAYVKNVKFDVEKAYEGIRKNVFERTMLPWISEAATELDQCYYDNGFFPALAPDQTEWVKEVHGFEGRQAVSVTLEHSYTDWCAALLAKALGKTDDAEILFKRSNNYKNVFNKETCFMSPKTADGKFIDGFNPKLSGGQGGRLYFSENNSWVYTFSVFHDIEGLIDLFGGKEAFAERLTKLFTESLETSKYDFLKLFPDSTGLMGQFTMGNEPAFHIPYLFNYVGEDYKTQRKIHEIIKLWFTNHPLGICGDEDGGAMSAWLVFSAMGFYPVCPGKPIYDIGSPIFDEITIQTDKANFTIKAEGAASKAKFIKSAEFMGKPYDGNTIKHEDLYKGGTLEFVMTDRR
jgi:alpha-1,2-mannosidase, putative